MIGGSSLTYNGRTTSTTGLYSHHVSPEYIQGLYAQYHVLEARPNPVKFAKSYPLKKPPLGLKEKERSRKFHKLFWTRYLKKGIVPFSPKEVTSLL